MTYREASKKLLHLLDTIEETYKIDPRNSVVINGVDYKTSDFKSFRKMIHKIDEICDVSVSTSTRYIQNNRDYHNVVRMLNYYRNKVNKKPKDFKRIEELESQLDLEKEKKEMKQAAQKLHEYRKKMKKIEKEQRGALTK